MRAPLCIVWVVLASCTSAQPVTGTRAFSTTWRDDIAPRLLGACGDCHGSLASGGYRVDSYAEAIGTHHASGPIAIAGEASSRLLTILDQAVAVPPHAGNVELYALLRTWVLTDALAYERSLVHGGGILNPAAPDFHGRVLAESGWSFPLCQKCHGEDFSGGIAAASCLSCHADKPTSCTTCHGATPATGAHRAHVVGGALLGKSLACTECHITPNAWDDPGHLRNADGTRVTMPVQVVFGTLARTASDTRLGEPRYADGQCTNVYCHGATSPDAKATAQSPLWDGGGTTCTWCHGMPPTDHPFGACVSCHSGVLDASGTLRPGQHITGKTTLGNGDGTCSACHTLLGGAHTSHLTGTHKLAAKLACSECHRVPTVVSSPGHFTSDGNAAVFPLGGAGSLASADGAQPAYAADAMRCTNTYCHGGGAKILGDTSIEVIRAPTWQPGTGAGRCGTCHGLPPLDGVHDPAWQITQCWQCHGKSVDAFGQILFQNGASTHLNGVVDAP